MPHSDRQEDADVNARLAAAVLQRHSYSSSAVRTLCLELQQGAECAAHVHAALPPVYGIDHICLFVALDERQVTAALWNDTAAVDRIECMLWALRSAPLLSAATFSLHVELRSGGADSDRHAAWRSVSECGCKHHAKHSVSSYAQEPFDLSLTRVILVLYPSQVGRFRSRRNCESHVCAQQRQPS